MLYTYYILGHIASIITIYNLKNEPLNQIVTTKYILYLKMFGSLTYSLNIIIWELESSYYKFNLILISKTEPETFVHRGILSHLAKNSKYQDKSYKIINIYCIKLKSLIMFYFLFFVQVKIQIENTTIDLIWS